MTENADSLLTSAEVARLFRVDPKTVTCWRRAGRIAGIKTPGGHHRFRESDVRQMLNENFDVAFTPGEPFVSSDGPRSGFVVGECRHAVAQSEWNAGLKNCERCGG